MDYWVRLTVRQARRIFITIIGATLLLIGLALLFLPGPGTVILGAGMAVLATEFIWARRVLNRIRQGATDVGNSFMRRWRGEKKEPRNGDRDQE